MRAYLGIKVNVVELLKEITLPKSSTLNEARDHHITLFFFGDLSEDGVKNLIEKLASFKYNSFSLIADKIMAFPGSQNPKVFAIGFKKSKELFKLHEKLRSLLGLPDEEEFKPHITIMRARNLDKRFKQSDEIYIHAKIKPFEIKVQEFGLYKSEPEKGLNRYTTLKTFKLNL